MRGPRVSGARDRDQRLRRPDLPDRPILRQRERQRRHRASRRGADDLGPAQRRGGRGRSGGYHRGPAGPLRDPVADGQRRCRPGPSRATARRGRLRRERWTPPNALRRGSAFPGMEVREPRSRSSPDAPGRAAREAAPAGAHTDVVPAGEPASWTTPAFAPESRDGRVFGASMRHEGRAGAALEAMRAVSRAVGPAGRTASPAR